MGKKKTVPQKKGTGRESERCCRLLNTSFSGKGQTTIEIERPTEAQAERNRRYVERYVDRMRQLTRKMFGGPDLRIGK